jgi:hypothetical protein
MVEANHNCSGFCVCADTALIGECCQVSCQLGRCRFAGTGYWRMSQTLHLKYFIHQLRNWAVDVGQFFREQSAMVAILENALNIKSGQSQNRGRCHRTSNVCTSTFVQHLGAITHPANAAWTQSAKLPLKNTLRNGYLLLMSSVWVICVVFALEQEEQHMPSH